MRIRRGLLTVVAALTVGCQADDVRQKPASPFPAESAVTCESLAAPAKWMPWLSEPGSRLVLNPTVGNQASNLAPATLPGLPMRLAYFVGEKPVTMPNLWSWAVARDGEQTIKPVDLADASAWREDGGTVRWDDTTARVTIEHGPVSFIEHTITADLSRTPWLLIDLPPLGDGVVWAAKVNDGEGGADIYLQRDTHEAGPHAFDIAAATGWKGERRFNIRLFAVGPNGRAASFVAPTLAAGPNVDPLASTGVTWRPHRVDASAIGGKMSVEATTFFQGDHSVAQCLNIRAGHGRLVLSGETAGQPVYWDAANHRLQIFGEFAAVIEFSRTPRFIGTWKHRRDLLEGAKPIDPKGESATCWSLAFDDLGPGDRLVVTASFSASPRVAFEPMTPSPAAFDQGVAQRSREWGERLSHVPAPATFSLTSIDPRGVDSAHLRQTYYKAWAFLFSTILPPMPENDCPFPQLACGKASTWDEGHPRASASAQWESMIGIQLISLVDPDTAWRAYEGMMSLVADDGTMGGEGLPSRHAQTAWILWNQTHDAARLRATYAPMKRMLLWKIGDPRWIYRGQTPAGQKDAEFVVHALLDIEYAKQIANVLGMPDEVAQWQRQSDQLAANYKSWFWEKPKSASPGVPYRIYETADGSRHDRGGSWTLQGLALPPQLLDGPQRESLLTLLRAQWKADRAFLLPNLTKHATYLLAARGMQRYGTEAEATQMLETAARDVTRAGELAEWYGQSGIDSKPAGVAPSIFGAAMIIDAWLLRNGIDVMPLP